jgi:hypothetical protein
VTRLSGDVAPRGRFFVPIFHLATQINSIMKEKLFADGFRFKRRENAPDFVVGQLSARVEDAIETLRKHDKKGWVNMNILRGRSGNFYLEIDTYEKEQSAPAPETSAPKPSAPTYDDIPF